MVRIAHQKKASKRKHNLLPQKKSKLPTVKKKKTSGPMKRHIFFNSYEERTKITTYTCRTTPTTIPLESPHHYPHTQGLSLKT